MPQRTPSTHGSTVEDNCLYLPSSHPLSETSIDSVLHRCSISYNIPLYTLPAHTPEIGKVDAVGLETPSLTLEQPSKLPLGRKEAKIPGLQIAGT